MINGTLWKDVDGNDIQAHGGCIIEFENTYYWYGENKGQPNCPGRRRVDVIGISCYSSKDLVNWKYEGLVLEAEKNDTSHPLHTSKVVERPKVVYNEKTKKFILWMHIDSSDYTLMSTGVAVSDSPTGPFVLVDVSRPNEVDSQDMTIFKDESGDAYIIHTTDSDKTLCVTALDDTFTKAVGDNSLIMAGQYREAPAVCKYNDTYYIVTSGCTGWDPNSALYATSKNIMGDFVLIESPCEGENYRNTFGGQSTFIFNVNGTFYLMIDHWKPYDLEHSGYSILPLEFEKRRMTVRWQNEWLGI